MCSVMNSMCGFRRMRYRRCDSFTFSCFQLQAWMLAKYSFAGTCVGLYLSKGCIIKHEKVPGFDTADREIGCTTTGSYC